jgi:hypothetical protein
MHAGAARPLSRTGWRAGEGPACRISNADCCNTTTNRGRPAPMGRSAAPRPACSARRPGPTPSSPWQSLPLGSPAARSPRTSRVPGGTCAAPAPCKPHSGPRCAPLTPKTLEPPRRGAQTQRMRRPSARGLLEPAGAAADAVPGDQPELRAVLEEHVACGGGGGGGGAAGCQRPSRRPLQRAACSPGRRGWSCCASQPSCARCAARQARHRAEARRTCCLRRVDADAICGGGAG